MDYYGSMVPSLRTWRLALISALVLGTLPAWSQDDAPSPTQAAQATEDTISPAEQAAALDAELFYNLLVGEMSAAQGDLTNAVALLMEAARELQSPTLYRRAADLALQGRSGPRALAVAKEWQKNLPESRDANRYMLQILLALNRVSESQETLSREVSFTPAASKPASYLAIAQLYSRVSDKQLAAAVVEQALLPDLHHPVYGAAAWATVGHLRLAAGQPALALQAARHAFAQSPQDGATAMLALELLESGHPEAEAMALPYLANTPAPAIRHAYARVLTQLNRNDDARQQLELLVREAPDMPDGWLALASLQAQAHEYRAAQRALERFTATANQLTEPALRQQALSQGYMLSARIALINQQYDQVLNTLNKIEQGSNDLAVQSLRAQALAKQGKLAQGRAAIRAVPAQNAAQEQLKRRAEVQLLRDAGAPQEAYLLQLTLHQQSPDDVDIAYDTAILAEAAGKIDVMERLLRDIIARKPDHFHAYNALGYSMADRGVQLDEARQLIETALRHAPNDPFITDSLGWAQFRSGDKKKALATLEKAYALRDDVEIAAHLGEVLWSLGERERALNIWRKAWTRDRDNTTLRNTLQRLQVKL